MANRTVADLIRELSKFPSTMPLGDKHGCNMDGVAVDADFSFYEMNGTLILDVCLVPENDEDEDEDDGN